MLTPLGEKLEKQAEAREVFHQILLPKLSKRGAETIDQMVGKGLEAFRLKLEPAELRDLLELARRHGLIEPVSAERDAYGNVLGATQWLPSPRGRELQLPTALTFTHVFGSVKAMTPAGAKMAPLLGTGLVVLAGLLPFIAHLTDISPKSTGAIPLKAWAVVLATLVIVCLAVGLFRGMKDDAKLRQAARAWDRLKKTWPGFWKLQVSTWRPWLGFLGGLMFVGPGVLVLIGVHWHWWLAVVDLAGAAILLVLAVVWHCYSRKRVELSAPPVAAAQAAEP